MQNNNLVQTSFSGRTSVVVGYRRRCCIGAHDVAVTKPDQLSPWRKNLCTTRNRGLTDVWGGNMRASRSCGPHGTQALLKEANVGPIGPISWCSVAPRALGSWKKAEAQEKRLLDGLHVGET
jgi:hypothetical protein